MDVGPIKGDSEKIRSIITKANDKAASDPFGALADAVEAIRMSGGDDSAIMQVLQAAKDNHQRVVLAQEQPGPNWTRVAPLRARSHLPAGTMAGL